MRGKESPFRKHKTGMGAKEHQTNQDGCEVYFTSSYWPHTQINNKLQ